MKSFCIKTNNLNEINYLLEQLNNTNIEDVYYSQKEFKIYHNVIVHYLGGNIPKFYETLSQIIYNVIIKFYEERLIKEIVNFNYFYFDQFEKGQICNNCLEVLNSDEYLERANTKLFIDTEILRYLIENKSMILSGFVRFRLKDYIRIIDDVTDIAVNKYIIEKEYAEFINLLRIYVDSKMPTTDVLHLIYTNGESIILDENKDIVTASDEVFNAKYLSDISFSSNDFALNTLLTLLPKKIEMHLIDVEDEFINTIKLIFEGRVSICKDCNICRTYHIGDGSL